MKQINNSHCHSCEEDTVDSKLNECNNSLRDCGHHCNHSWTHDEYCWCGQKFGKAKPQPIIREEVLLFATTMEEKLKQNDDKTHWCNESYEYLLNCLDKEVLELKEAIATGIGAPEEAADVANFAMMIADNAKRRDK